MGNYKIIAQIEATDYNIKVEPKECHNYSDLSGRSVKQPGIHISYTRKQPLSLNPVEFSIHLNDEDFENLVYAVKEVMRLREKNKLDESIEMLNK